MPDPAPPPGRAAALAALAAAWTAWRSGPDAATVAPLVAAATPHLAALWAAALPGGPPPGDDADRPLAPGETMWRSAWPRRAIDVDEPFAASWFAETLVAGVAELVAAYRREVDPARPPAAVAVALHAERAAYLVTVFPWVRAVMAAPEAAEPPPAGDAALAGPGGPG